MLSQTDANGVQTTFQYDNTGRLISKTTPEVFTSMEYVENGNGINQLKAIRNSNDIHYI